MRERPKQRYKHAYAWNALRAFLVILIFILFLGTLLDWKIQTARGIIMFHDDLFWSVGIGAMVLTIYFAPMLWRNICPLATANLLYFSLFHRKKLEVIGASANTLHGIRGKIWQFLRKNGTAISAVVFWAIVPARLIFFNENSYATAILLLVIFSAAIIMGILFPVKSGWCTSICPVNAVEKTYGINPAIRVKNHRCHYRYNGTVLSCSGCTVNCIDTISPKFSYWKTQTQKAFHDTFDTKIRRLFVATFPGFILAFFTLLNGLILPPPEAPRVFTIYVIVGAFMVLSAIPYYLLKHFFFAFTTANNGEIHIEKPNDFYAKRKHRMDIIYVASCINIFMLFAANSVFMSIFPVLFPVSAPLARLLYATALIGLLIFSIYVVKKSWNEGIAPNSQKNS